ncbi:MAG: D-alanyl-D-alanine carboxypeptidase [Butyrivibrio sp.]|nr:D-alanyl-D-alanine carboxypeptidase [Butyrivibrio sp.]
MKRFISGVLVTLLLFNIFLPIKCTAASEFEEAAELRKELPVDTNSIPEWPKGPAIGAEAAILMEVDSGTILYAKNIHEKLYPASTTKIMTTQLAMELAKLDEMVTFSYEDVFSIPRNSSNIAIDVGEQITVDQCLQAILIASANEVANGLAEHCGGTIDDFVKLMNERAEELGCKDTHFVTPNGLHDENHYTTAYDMALMAIPFFANELLCKYASTSKLHLAATSTQPDDIVAWSKNDLYSGRKYAYEYLVGSKTGFTDDARQTLVSCAEKDGMRLICVIFKEESPCQFTDTVDLFNYGFGNFQKINIYENETRYRINDDSFFFSDNDIFGSSESLISLDTESSIVIPKTADFKDVESALSYDNPEKGTIATLNYTFNGNEVGKASILLNDDSATYEFNGEMNYTEATLEKPQEEEEKVVFLNVKMIIIIIVAAAFFFIMLLFVIAVIKSYNFDRGRGRKRRRRRRKNYGKNKNLHF